MSVGRLYTIVDAETSAAAGWRVPDLAQAVLAGGARWIQIRARQTPGGQFLEWCDEVRMLAEPVGARVVVNDRVDLAAMARIDGVHLGQEDLGVRAVRALLPTTAIVGLSTHTVNQIDAARREPIDYVAVGPVFQTRTKTTGIAAVGVSLVGRAARCEPAVPVVAIGGITLATAAAVIDAGATAVAVISDLLTGGDPERKAAAYVAALR